MVGASDAESQDASKAQFMVQQDGAHRMAGASDAESKDA